MDNGEKISLSNALSNNLFLEIKAWNDPFIRWGVYMEVE